MNTNMKNGLLALGLGSLAIATRFLPHAPNFTAVGAVAIFAGSILPRRWAMVIPLGIMATADVYLGGYTPVVMASVYASFAAVFFIGRWISRERSFHRIAIGTLSSSLLFFLVTNFAVWAATPMYAKTFTGLLTAYALAVPFYRNMLAGDVVYCGALFGTWYSIRAIVMWYAHRRIDLKSSNLVV